MTDEQALRDFIARHSKPYDPETDIYDRPPFAEDIKEGKNNPIYGAHSYHTKVPPRIIVPYILHYTEPGDLILDPFCGSGMTGVAAQMCANPPADLLAQFPELQDRVGPRHAVLNDLSPAACHIAYNYTTPVDAEALKTEIERIKNAVKDEFDWLYGTEHYQPAVGLYDPKNPAVSERLRDETQESDSAASFFPVQERTWEVLSTAEVEHRLGYAVTHLPIAEEWGDLDPANVSEWICIPAIVQYTVWSDVYRCEGFVTIIEPTGRVSRRGRDSGKRILSKNRVLRGCGGEIALWTAAVNPESGEVSELFECPACKLRWKKTQLRRVGCVPVVANVLYEGIKRTKEAVRIAPIRYTRPITTVELGRIGQIEATAIPYWVPETEMDPQGPRYRRSALSVKGIRRVVDFWTPRNRWALASLWTRVTALRPARLKSAAEFLLTSFAPRVSRKAEFRQAGGAGNTHNLVIPSITREDNVLKSMAAKEVDVFCYFSLGLCAGSSRTCVVNRSATSLPTIPSNVVDYIFTDPPFGSNIYYSESNLLWEAWLDQIADATEEAVVHRLNDGGTKRLPDYARLMGLAFSEMFRVLKPGRWATVEFNNSDGAVFEVIKQAVHGAGFEIASMLLLDKQQKTFIQIKGAEDMTDVVDKDVVFNLYKPAHYCASDVTPDLDLEHRIVDAVREHLRRLPEQINADPGKYSDDHRTTATINSMLMNTLIPQGVSVERLNLPFIERVCSRYFRKVGQRWYLRGEPVGFSNGWPQLIEEEVAIKDEVSAIEWLRQHVKLRPMLLGELKPLWMRATGLLPAEISRDLVLEDVLAENFWRDPDTNRWREPTSEERERINDDRSIRVLHDAERCVAGSLRRSTDDSERCEWIDVIFDACKAIEEEGAAATPALRGFDPNEGYRIIGRLFQTVLRERVGPAAYGRAEKQARVASQRLARQAQQETTRAAERDAKDRGPTLFD